MVMIPPEISSLQSELPPKPPGIDVVPSVALIPSSSDTMEMLPSVMEITFPSRPSLHWDISIVSGANVRVSSLCMPSSPV